MALFLFFPMGKLILQQRRMQEGYLRIERMSQLLSLGIPSSTQGRKGAVPRAAGDGEVWQECSAAGAPTTLRRLRSCCQVTACCLFHFLIPTNACGWVSGQGAGDTNQQGTLCTHPNSPTLAPTPTLSPGHRQPLPSAAGWACSGRSPSYWGCGGTGAGSVPGRGDSPVTCDGAKSPEGAGGLALLGPVPALSTGHRPGLVPQLYKGGVALGQQQLLCKDCLCHFGMCCLYPTGALTVG